MSDAPSPEVVEYDVAALAADRRGAPAKRVCIGALPLRLTEGQTEVVFSIADPAVVRAVGWCLEKRLVMAAGAPQFDEVLTLFVEFAPNATQRKHRYLVTPTGKAVGVPDGYALLFVGTAISSQTGAIAHVYEVREVS
jgi:hypothetical protein